MQGIPIVLESQLLIWESIYRSKTRSSDAGTGLALSSSLGTSGTSQRDILSELCWRWVKIISPVLTSMLMDKSWMFAGVMAFPPVGSAMHHRLSHSSYAA